MPLVVQTCVNLLVQAHTIWTRTCVTLLQTCRITSAPLQELSTDKQVTDDEVKALLASSLKSKKKNKKKKAPKAENGVKDEEAAE